MKKLVSLGVASASALLLGGTLVQAAPATTVPVDSTGEIKLKDTWEEGGIVDPEGPGPETTDPDKPVPPAGDRDLALVYYPTFDFGFHDYDGDKAVTYQAKAYTGTINNPEDPAASGQKKTNPQFVQIRNSSKTNKWTLQVKATPFKANDSSAKELTGAQITIKDIKAVNNTENGGAATATTDALALSDKAQTIGTYDNEGMTGISRNSFLFGEVKKVTEYGLDETGTSLVDQDVSTGVELYLPANLDLTEDGSYMATMTWSFADVE